MSIIRVAILDCDPLVPAIRAKYHDYGGVVTHFLKAGCTRLNLSSGLHEFSVWKVTKEGFQYPSLETVDSLIITGSSERPYLSSSLGVSLSCD